MPEGINAVKGLDEKLRLQDRVARKLQALGHCTVLFIFKQSKPVRSLTVMKLRI